MAPPFKPFDHKLFEAMCQVQATQLEMMGVLGYKHVDTLIRAVKRHYKESYGVVYARHSAASKISLRRQFWKMAISGQNTRATIKACEVYLEEFQENRTDSIDVTEVSKALNAEDNKWSVTIMKKKEPNASS